MSHETWVMKNMTKVVHFLAKSTCRCIYSRVCIWSKNLLSTTFFIFLFVPEIRVCTCRISLCFVWLENDILPYISASGTLALTRLCAGPPGGREPCRGEVEVHQCTMGQTLLPLGPERESAVMFGQAGRRLWPLPSLPERVWGALGDGMIHMLINERDGDGFSWGKIRHADRSQGGCHGSVAVAPQAKLNHSYTRPTFYSSSHTSKSHACRKPKVVRLGWMNELWEDLLQDAVLDCLFCLAGQTKRTLYLMNLNSWNFGKGLYSNKKQFS